MHVVIVTDQHPESLGGAQVSIRLQRTYLERAGHTVTIVAPRRHARATSPGGSELDRFRGSVIELPALSITRDREYAASWPGRASVRRVARALDGRQRVDLVHVQGDFWGALIGYQLARTLDVPVVNTMHNNLDVGTRAVTPFAPLVFHALGAARRLMLGPAPEGARGTRGGWKYLAALAAITDQVVVPSDHFARDLERHGVPGSFDVIPTGVDDDVIDLIRMHPRERPARVRLIWCGRMSPEKRIMECLEAFSRALRAGAHAELVVVGGGLQLSQAQSLVRRAGMEDRVRFTGPLGHDETLAELYAADALIQTSIGFETQGMTPYEATALGTPTVFCDHDIAAALRVSPAWLASDESIASLADALSVAVREIERGKRVQEDVRVPAALSSEMRQSTRTAEMLRTYAKVVR